MKTTHRKYDDEAGDFRRLSRFILQHNGRPGTRFKGYCEAAITTLPSQSFVRRWARREARGRRTSVRPRRARKAHRPGIKRPGWTAVA
ncbi:MAG: hypothetical protein IPH82_17085 [Chloroflexi bacterium]|nr:hypothetical protein [Chloroflexota bacterium]